MSTETAEIDLAEELLKQARLDVLNHFEEARKAKLKESSWKSGILKTKDILELESKGDKVETSVESGEYFYKIIFNSNKQ